MKNFDSFGLSDDLNRSLAKMNYTSPTPIQEKAIPLALKGHDILGSAQTGTGKTAAFSIPMVEKLLRSPNGGGLILTPTRELAKQVLEVVHQLLGYKSPIKTAFIIGGEAMGKQYNQLRANPRIIVGTPGRINDHLERGTIKLNETNFLVLDETDRMLDMGFGVQLDRILKFLPQERQTLMFSATLPNEIVRLSSKYLNNPERVSVGDSNVVAVNIKQEVIRIEHDQKYKELLTQLHERTGSVIIFAKTKHNADRMSTNLRRDGFTSDALHGDLRQNKRDRVMQNFRKMNFRILVATDIAARGLDVPHIEHVINYDLPQVAEDYIHRMGRTARAGAQGSAISFVSREDGRKWRAIELLLDPSASSNDSGYKDDYKRGKPKRNAGPRHGNASKGGYKGKPSFRDDAPRGDAPRGNAGGGYKGKPSFRDDAPRGDAPRGDAPRGNSFKGGTARSEAFKSDSRNGDAPRSRPARGNGDAPRSGQPSKGQPYKGKDTRGSTAPRGVQPTKAKSSKDGGSYAQKGKPAGKRPFSNRAA